MDCHAGLSKFKFPATPPKLEPNDDLLHEQLQGGGRRRERGHKRAGRSDRAKGEAAFTNHFVIPGLTSQLFLAASREEPVLHGVARRVRTGADRAPEVTEGLGPLSRRSGAENRGRERRSRRRGT